MGRAADQGGQGVRLRSDAPTRSAQYRGTLTEPGKESPYRNRSRRREPRPVRAHAGRRVPRRLAHAARQDRHGVAEPEHARSGDVPHPARRRITAPATSGASIRCTTTRTGSRIRSSSITHSICTLEFEDHRPLYDWFVEQLGIYPSAADRVRPPEPHLHAAEQAQAAAAGAGRPRARLGRSAHADASPAFAAAATRRRRSAISARAIGVSKTNGTIELALLEHFVREDLNKRAPRVMAVLRPLKVVIDNYPEGQVEEMEAVNNPEDASAGHAQGAVLARALHRAGRFPRRSAQAVSSASRPGREVRLRYGYFITCTERGEERRRARWSRSTAPTIRRRAAATRPTAAR